MVIGLVFFIRASTKDRIEVAQFSSVQEADALRQAVTNYFYSRSYQPLSKEITGKTAEEATDPFANSASSGVTIIDGTTLVGIVRPSLFMAVFLSALAAVGFACLALIVATLFPSWGGWLLSLVAASPLAGVFYWKKSSRPETITLRVDSWAEAKRREANQNEPATGSNVDSNVSDRAQWMSKLIVKGHRDELANLEDAFSQPKLKAWAQLEKIEAS
jgi:hypothetical protein